VRNYKGSEKLSLTHYEIIDYNVGLMRTACTITTNVGQSETVVNIILEI
jgi:hypothetical protein